MLLFTLQVHLRQRETLMLTIMSTREFGEVNEWRIAEAIAVLVGANAGDFISGLDDQSVHGAV
jgi:hypothetical protein